jgi:hypothetical protein
MPISSLPTLAVGPYDPATDTIEIEGTRYSGMLFRAFGFAAQIGKRLEIIRQADHVLTVLSLPSTDTCPLCGGSPPEGK